jgi:outer membrane receptor protein involved in Fe transport
MSCSGRKNSLAVSNSEYGDNFVQNGEESPLGYVLSKFSQRVVEHTAQQMQSTPAEDLIIHPYSLLNAQVEFIPPKGKWSFIASVTNLTNKFYYYYLFNGGAVNISSNVAPPPGVPFHSQT